MQKELLCRRKCWKPWSEWGACGKCNTGSRKRTRAKDIPSDCKGIPCPGPSEESQKCLITCGEGGQARLEKCYCRIGWTGDCCQTRKLSHTSDQTREVLLPYWLDGGLLSDT